MEKLTSSNGQTIARQVLQVARDRVMKIVVALALVLASVAWANTGSAQGADTPGAVYAMTNEATANRIMVFKRSADGLLTPGGSFPTGGQGSGQFENSANGLILSEQAPNNLNGSTKFLFATNAGSDSISVFRVEPATDGLVLVDQEPSGGLKPISVTVHKNLLYVLNSGEGNSCMGANPNIRGFRISPRGELTPLPGSTRPLTAQSAAGCAQISFNPSGDVIVVTERAANIIDTYVVDQGTGLTTGPIPNSPPNTQGPFGFTFTQRGQLLATINRGGIQGGGAASSYEVTREGVLIPISGPVNNTRSDTCWFVVTDNDKYGYVTNLQSGDLSSYRVEPDGTLILLQPIAAVLGPPESGPADQALSRYRCNDVGMPKQPTDR